MNCEEDKDRFQKGVEKDLIALSEESIPVNTRQKAMWAYRLYENWAQWRKDAYDPRVDFSTGSSGTLVVNISGGNCNILQ